MSPSTVQEGAVIDVCCTGGGKCEALVCFPKPEWISRAVMGTDRIRI